MALLNPYMPLYGFYCSISTVEQVNNGREGKEVTGSFGISFTLL